MFKKLIKSGICFNILFLYSISLSFADNHNVYEVLKLIQKDLKTLERAVYSEPKLDSSTETSSKENLDQNSEDVLTRHLLKLSEIESQFQELTNKFEEINFKLDKLSNRLSKVQADNQIRFQDLESGNINIKTNDNKKILSEPTEEKKILPGSSNHKI